MEKTRVKKGEKYWYIRYNYNKPFDLWFVVDWGIEDSDENVNSRFDRGNYFHTKEEAEQIAKKLRAVLKGADVIEMPSEEEILDVAMKKFNNEDDSARDVMDFQVACDWLKSKIIK